MRYRDFPKGDARRYFVVLLAIDTMKPGEATIHRVSTAIGCTRAEAQRAVHAMVEQFAVCIDRDGPVYSITSWGVLKKGELAKLVSSLPVGVNDKTLSGRSCNHAEPIASQ